MTANVHVFLGPSLAQAQARAILPATYLPPVAMGDVYRSVRQGADAIVIIDGLFEQLPSVFHKEILFALEQGVPVWGASSMGALRAAELYPFGMRGVGAIFERYRDGVYEDDDEVAVAHAPAADGWKPLSEAMVNIRETLAQAEQAGAVDVETASQLITLAKSLFYTERTWPMLWQRAGEVLPAEVVSRARAHVTAHAVNLKRADAERVLSEVAVAVAAAGGELPQASPPVRLERTIFWQRLVDDREGAWLADGATTQEELRSFALVNSTRRRDVLRLALLDQMSNWEARRVGLRIDAEDIQAAADRFRRERGLISGQALSRWLDDNGLDAEDFTYLMRLEATLDGLVLHHGRSLHARVLDVLRRQDRFSELRRGHARKVDQLRQMGIERPTLEDAGTSLDGVIRWYSDRFGPLCGGPAEEAKLLGFETQLDFVTEVLGTYLANRSEA